MIKVWREVFKKFKMKKGVRFFIEVLLKRVYNGNNIGIINFLVDIYNFILLKYVLFCGGEDIDKFIGDIRLIRVIGNEEFILLGIDENLFLYEGEIIYKDDGGVICRCWNWCEVVRIMFIEDINNVFLCIELVDESRFKEFENVLNELVKIV